MNRLKTVLTFSFLLLALSFFSSAQAAETLKPFVLGKAVPGTMADVVAHASTKLTEQGFTVVGTYSPYPNATVICASHPE